MIVFDTGALIAVERRKQRMLDVWKAAMRARVPILVPGAVISEWWRGPVLGTFFRLFLCIVFAQVRSRLFISSADSRELAVPKRLAYLEEDAPE